MIFQVFPSAHDNASHNVGYKTTCTVGSIFLKEIIKNKCNCTFLPRDGILQLCFFYLYQQIFSENNVPLKKHGLKLKDFRDAYPRFPPIRVCIVYSMVKLSWREFSSRSFLLLLIFSSLVCTHDLLLLKCMKKCWKAGSSLLSKHFGFQTFKHSKCCKMTLFNARALKPCHLAKLFMLLFLFFCNCNLSYKKYILRKIGRVISVTDVKHWFEFSALLL